MADEADDVAEVKLTADTSGFEQSMRTSAAAVDAWASRVAGRFDALGKSVAAKAEKVSSFMNSVGEGLGEDATNEDKWKAVGTKLAEGLLGTRVTGVLAEVGKAMGEQLGSAASDAVDFAGVQEKLEGLKANASAFWEDLKTAGLGFKDSVANAFTDLTAKVGEVNIGGLVRGSFDDATAFLDTFKADVGGRLKELGFEVLARVRDLIDSAFAKIQEPVSAFADRVQQGLQWLGLIEEGTDKWGDSIRSLEQVGNKVFVALATGFGHVNDALVIAGGYVKEYLVAPFLWAVEKIVEGLKEVAKGIADLDPSGFSDKLVEGVAKLEERIKNMKESIKNAGKEEQQRGFVTGKKWAGEIVGDIDAGAVRNEFNDLKRNLDREWDLALAGKAKPEEPFFHDLLTAIRNVGPGEARLDSRRVEALQAGTQEANRAIVHFNNPNANTPQQKGLMQQEKQTGLLEKILEQLKNPKPVEVEAI